MAGLKTVQTRMGIVGQLFRFLWQQKLWWMMPMVFMLLLFSVLIFFAHGTAMSPFIYTLF